MDSMVGRKHHQDMDDGMGLGMNHGGGTSSRKHKKRKTTRGDIDVGGEFDGICSCSRGREGVRSNLVLLE